MRKLSEPEAFLESGRASAIAGEQCAPLTSYVVDGGPVGFLREVERLRQQVELSWHKERLLLDSLAISQRPDILDVGCGPGFFTERLAAKLPMANIVGVDTNLDMLEKARTRIVALYGKRVQFVEGELPSRLPNGFQFDLVICRYVLQHLLDPAAAVSSIYSALKPGGYALLIDVDAELLGLSCPSNPHIASIYRRAGAKQARLGGNRAIGRFLYRYLMAGGFSEIDLTALVIHNDEISISRLDHQMNPDLLEAAVNDGSISPAEHAFVCSEYQRFLTSPDPLVLMILFAATGRRAADS
jgi:ubiquinone/menaquinone biosynthesis C-methylase UbiE